MIVLGIMWCAAAMAAVWKGSQLARVPYDRGLQIVTTCTALVLAALTAQVVTALPGTHFPRQTPVLIEFILLNFFFVLLLGLLRTSGAQSDISRGPFLADLGLAVVAGTILVITFVLTEPSHSGANYGDYTEASGPAGVLVFHLVGNLFLAYATARGAYLAWTAARHALSAHTRIGLRVAAVGLAIACLGNHVPRVIAQTGRLTIDEPILPGTATWTPALLAAGVALFFLGVGYPGARTAVVKTRLWVQAKRRYHELRPLWEILYREFPTIALFPDRGPRRDWFTVRRMRMRYYRRVIECRDGLVCLSPYMSSSVPTDSPAEQAALVRAAIERRAAATDPTISSVIAPPREPGMEGDARAVIALSRAL